MASRKATGGGCGVGGYATADARVAWHPVVPVELCLVGDNLLTSRHPEFIAAQAVITLRTLVERGMYGATT